MVALSDSDYFVNEDGASVTITAQISGDRSMDVTVDYTTADGAAVAGSDYTTTSGTLPLLPQTLRRSSAFPSWMMPFMKVMSGFRYAYQSVQCRAGHAG